MTVIFCKKRRRKNWPGKRSLGNKCIAKRFPGSLTRSSVISSWRNRPWKLNLLKFLKILKNLKNFTWNINRRMSGLSTLSSFHSLGQFDQTWRVISVTDDYKKVFLRIFFSKYIKIIQVIPPNRKNRIRKSKTSSCLRKFKIFLIVY